MKLKVDNFAKVCKADIDINGITVIAGENNIGKSTIGKILYSIFTVFHKFDEKLRKERVKGISRILFDVYLNKYAIEKFEKFVDICNKIVDQEKFDSTIIKAILKEGGLDKVSNDTLSRIRDQLEFETSELESLIVNDIFNEEFNGQITPMFDDGIVSNIEAIIQGKSIGIKFEKNKSSILSKIDLLNDGIYIDDPLIMDNLDKKIASGVDSSFILFHSFFGKDYSYTHKEVLKRKLSKSLQHNEALIDEAIYKKRIDKILSTIKNIVMGDFVEREDRFTFSEQNCNAEIELSNLSTGIKSFAIILKLLENKDINDNSIVVLDEPEVHLHPKWQLIYAELLVLLQKEFNLNIVLTTHSPYFVNSLEVYSRKYKIQDKCNYYLANLIKGKAYFENVTSNPEKIYEKLAEPFQILAREEDELSDIEL